MSQPAAPRPLVVVGDIMLDVDVDGRVDRLSPEAPVPVLTDATGRRRPGGAALAALLAARQHPRVVLLTALADDDAARSVTALLAGHVEVIGLPWAGSTPVKTRLRAGNHFFARLDSGGVGGALGAVPAAGHAAVMWAAAILVADYGGGVTADPDIRSLLAGRARRVPVVWDPHPRGAQPVAGCRLVTPNEREAAEAVAEHPGGSFTAVCAQANALRERWSVGAVAVTRGAGGALLAHPVGAPLVVPAPPVVAHDTCGAGDAFAAAATVAFARGAVPDEAVTFAVQAAARFVADGAATALDAYQGAPLDLCRRVPSEPRRGVPAGETAGGGADPARAIHSARQLIARVRAGGGRVVATGGCFDLLHAGHIATLQAARALGDCLVVCLNSDESVRRRKGPDRPLQAQQDRAAILAALRTVDAVVVFEQDTPEGILAELRPDVWVKGGDYAGAVLPEAAVLAGWGGEVVTVSYLPGYSTSELVNSARHR